MLHLVAPVADLLPRTIGPYVSLMLLGFFFGIAGHMTRSRWLVAIGVLMIFLATLVFPLARIATEDNPPQREDSRLPEIP
jgi:hypothetical protein